MQKQQQKTTASLIIAELSKISSREEENKEKNYFKKRILDGDISNEIFLHNIGGLYIQAKKSEVYQ